MLSACCQRQSHQCRHRRAHFVEPNAATPARNYRCHPRSEVRPGPRRRHSRFTSRHHFEPRTLELRAHRGLPRRSTPYVRMVQRSRSQSPRQTKRRGVTLRAQDLLLLFYSYTFIRFFSKASPSSRNSAVPPPSAHHNYSRTTAAPASSVPATPG